MGDAPKATGITLREPVSAVSQGGTVEARLLHPIRLATAIIAGALLLFMIPSAKAGLLGTGAASYCDSSSYQAFGNWGDQSNYMLMPGGSFEAGTPSWALSSGARIVSGNEPYFLHSRSDRHSLYLPSGSSASTPTMCFAAGDWHLRFLSVGPSRGAHLRVTVTVNSLLGVVSVLDGGTVASDGTWKPSPEVSLLLTNVGGLLTTKAVSFRFTASDGASQIDDVYLDPWKDT
jgi:hypothetical protein